MNQNILTIIIKIRDGHVPELEKYLRKHVNPEIGADHTRLECKEAMRFNQLRGLHFASFAILEDDTPIKKEQIEPCLMFEATFDGETNDFLDDLIDLSDEGLQMILKHCVGYPESGTQLKPMLRQYLLDHDVGYDTFFSGHPGQTVGQILGEDTLRRRVVRFARIALRQPAALATGFRNIQRQIRRDIVQSGPRKNAPDLRWVEERPAVPFLVRYGRQSAKGFGIFVLFVLACIILRVTEYDFLELGKCYQNPIVFSAPCSDIHQSGTLHHLLMAIVTFPFHVADGVSWISIWIPKYIAEGAVQNLLAILLVWLLFRTVAFFLSLWEYPEGAGISWVLLGALRQAVYFMRWITFFVLAAAAIIAFQPDSDKYVDQSHWLHIVGALVFATLILAVVWLLRRYVKSLPDDPHESIFKKRWKEFSVDLLQALMLVLLWFVLLPMAQWLPEAFSNELLYYTAFFVAVGAGAVLIVIAVYLILFVFLLSFFAREVLYDRRKYADATALTRPPTSSKNFEREAHGTNKVQNHLISLSYIKDTWWHKTTLRITLFAINLICRFWYNRGDLGGIHDIHFLRWIIIDNGRRLLFLDNYHGSWDAYLNAFIDGGAVKGMNAIWSHTYVRRADKDANGDTPVSYPETSCLMWQGARYERAFKEVVRTSQIETLVWYSAYPSLSGINILTSRALRDALFRDLDTASLDELAQRIR